MAYRNCSTVLVVNVAWKNCDSVFGTSRVSAFFVAVYPVFRSFLYMPYSKHGHSGISPPCHGGGNIGLHGWSGCLLCRSTECVRRNRFDVHFLWDNRHSGQLRENMWRLIWIVGCHSELVCRHHLDCLSWELSSCALKALSGQYSVLDRFSVEIREFGFGVGESRPFYIC